MSAPAIGVPANPTYAPPAGPAKPTSDPAAVQSFLASRDLRALAAQPLAFEKTEKVNGYLRCWACYWSLLSGTITTMIWPGWCCPGKFYDRHYLELNAEALKFTETGVDCCCHVYEKQKVVPLKTVKHASIEGGCVLDSYGLKRLIVSNGVQTLSVHVNDNSVHVESKEVIEADFLKNPELARDAIDAAVAIVKAGTAAAPAAQYVSR